MVAAYLFLASLSICDSDFVAGHGNASAIQSATGVDDDSSLDFDWTSDFCVDSLFAWSLGFCFDFEMMTDCVYPDVNDGSSFGGLDFSIGGQFAAHLFLTFAPSVLFRWEVLDLILGSE